MELNIPTGVKGKQEEVVTFETTAARSTFIPTSK